MFPVNDPTKPDNSGKPSGKLPSDTDEREFLDTDTGKKPDGKTEDSNEEKEDESDEDSEEEDGKDDEKESEEDGEEKEDEKEVEEEEEEPEVKADSLYQGLKGKYKDIFKEFPDLKTAIFREQRFTEIFPTVDDAKSAQEAAETFENFQKDIESGNPETLLQGVSQVGEEAFESFVGNFLPSLKKLNKDAYLQVVYPVFNELFRAAEKTGDERLSNSAKNLSIMLFGHADLSKDAGFKPKEADPAEDRVSKREREFEQRVFRSFATDVGSVGKGKLMRAITEPFKNSGLAPRLQKMFADDIFKEIDESLSKDPRHSSNMNSLWAQAKKAGYTPEWKDRIVNAYLSRAKGLVSKVRQQVLSEAKVSLSEKEPISDKKEKPRIPSSSMSRNVSGKVDPKKVDWDKTSERDILDGRAVMRK